MLYNRCTGICKFGNNTYSRRIRCRSNLGHIFQEKKYVLWAGKYGNMYVVNNYPVKSSKQDPSWEANMYTSSHMYVCVYVFCILL